MRNGTLVPQASAKFASFAAKNVLVSLRLMKKFLAIISLVLLLAGTRGTKEENQLFSFVPLVPFVVSSSSFADQRAFRPASQLS